MSPPVLGSCSLPETPPEASLSQCSLLIPQKKLRVSLPGPWSPLGLLLGLGRPPGRASGVHLVQPEALCLLWCPLLPEKPGVSGRGGGGPLPPCHSPEALCMVPRWEVSHGKRALGKNGPDLQRRGGVRRLGLSPHGSVGQSGWGGGGRCSVGGAVSGSFILACFQRDLMAAYQPAFRISSCFLWSWSGERGGQLSGHSGLWEQGAGV